MRTKTLTLLACGALGVLSLEASADQFHYNNLVIGTRATGMGGAFGAVADDASGVFYNPAGLAFALSNDISGSANAYYKKSATYKKALCGDDFEEESGGSVPAFIGGLQKLDRYVEGLVFAFGIYATDSDLKDQDTLIENYGTDKCGTTSVERYHRTSNARASTTYMGAAVGKRITNNLALGFGVNYFNVDELVQEFQGFTQTTPVTLPNGSSTTGWRTQSSNVRDHLVVHGFQPTLGVQAALPANFAVGLTVKAGIIASQKLDIAAETYRNTVSADEKAKQDAGQQAVSTLITDIRTEEPKKPLGTWPTEARAGVAWFASPTFLWTLDFTYHSAVEDADKMAIYGNRARYAKDAVTNVATGIEYYVAPAFPLRFGLFTNNDARPKVQKGTPDRATGTVCNGATDAAQEFTKKYCGQPDHIDFVGESLFIAWVQPNSQIAGGVVLQQGKGQAQKLGDHQVQDVKADSYTFAFSVTHNL